MSAARALLVGLEALFALWLVVVLHQDRTRWAYRLLPSASSSREIDLQLESDPGSTRLKPGSDVSSDRATLVVHAPPGRQIRLVRNGISTGERQVEEAAPLRQRVGLRRGPNVFEAELDTRPSDLGMGLSEQVKLAVVGRRDEPLHPVVVARTDGGLGGPILHAVAEPLWVIELCQWQGQRFVRIQERTDDTGAFYALPIAAGREPGYRLIGPAAPGTGVRAASPASECNPADYAPLRSAASPLARTLDIDVQARTVRVKGEVHLPMRSALFEWVIEGAITPQAFVEHVYGLRLGLQEPIGIDATYRAFNLEGPMVAGPMTRVSIDFTVPRSRLWLGQGWVPLMHLPEDRVSVTLGADEALQLRGPKPERSESDGRVRLTWSQPTKGLAGLLSLDAPSDGAGSDVDTPAGPRTSLDETTRQTSAYTAIQRIRELLPEHVNDLGHWIVAAIPLLWFGHVLRGTPGLAPDARRRLHGLAASLVVLHLAYIVVYLFSFDARRWLTPLATALLPDHDQQLLGEAFGGMGHSFPLALFAGVLLVLQLDRWFPPAPEGMAASPGPGWLAVRGLVIWPLALGVVGTMVAIPYLARWIAPGLDEAWRPYVAHVQPAAMVLLALSVGWIFVFYALRVPLRRGTSLKTAWLVSWLLILVPVLPALADIGAGLLRAALLENGRSPHLIPTSVDDVVWDGLTLLAGALLTMAMYRRVREVLGWRRPVTGSPLGRRAAWLAVLLLLTLPMAAGTGADGPWVLVHFAYFLLRLAPFLLLAAIWALLKHVNPGDRFGLSVNEARIFALLFAGYLCGGANNLLLVPIPMLLGYALARRYLLQAHAGSPLAIQARPALLAGLIGLRQEQKLQAAFRSHSEKKYLDGTLSRDQFDKGLEQASHRVRTAARMLPVSERELREQLFGFGPEAGSLANALFALRCSLPLVLLFQIAPLNAALGSGVGRYPLLELATPIVSSAGYWLVAAFTFGWFYHRLRGIDGPSKGLAFSVSMLLPALCVMVLNQQPLLAITAGEQILRIGLFVFALALAFDAAIVRRAGFEIRQLVLVYGIAPSLAFASSLVALGGLSFGPALKVAGCWSLRLFGFEGCATP